MLRSFSIFLFFLLGACSGRIDDEMYFLYRLVLSNIAGKVCMSSNPQNFPVLVALCSPLLRALAVVAVVAAVAVVAVVAHR